MQHSNIDTLHVKNTTPKKTAAKTTAKPATKKTTKATETKESKPVAKKTAKKKSIEITAITGEILAKLIAQGMYEKKAEDIKILDMRKLHNASTDYFVISHASNDKQVEAIANSVEEEVQKDIGEKPGHREGFENLEWVLLDYFNVVAHVFQEEKREFYGIEDLWGDAEIVEFKGK